MKLLLDNNVPTFLQHVFEGHTVATAAAEGWQELANGKLLDSAERAGYDVLVTLDRGFYHQQNLSGREIAVLLLVPGSQRRPAQEDIARKALLGLTAIRP